MPEIVLVLILHIRGEQLIALLLMGCILCMYHLYLDFVTFQNLILKTIKLKKIKLTVKRFVYDYEIKFWIKF